MPLLSSMPTYALDPQRYEELKIKPARALTPIEEKLLDRQERFDESNFGFFHVFLT